jgi:hypothetical protein
MLTRTRTITCAAAAVAVGSGGATALATTAPTWTVTPGGTITAALRRERGLVHRALRPKRACLQYVEPERQPAAGQWPAGPWHRLRHRVFLAGCNADTGSTFTSSGFPWHLNARSYDPATGVTSGRLSGIHLSWTISVIPCSAVVDGTSGTASNGTIPFTYNNATHVLRLHKGGNLHLWDNTCPNVANGTRMTLSGSYKVSPGQTITSP